MPEAKGTRIEWPERKLLPTQSGKRVRGGEGVMSKPHASFLTSARWAALNSFLHALNEEDAPNHAPLDHRPVIKTALSRARSFEEYERIRVLGDVLKERFPETGRKKELHSAVLALSPDDLA